MMRVRPLVVVVSVILSDFVSKNIVQRLAAPLNIAADVSLQAAQNTRGLFGSLPLSLTVVLSSVVLLVLLFVLRRAVSRRERLGLSLIVGGGVANLTERMAMGHVTDILLIRDLSAWNVADVAILAGIALVIFGQSFRSVGQSRRFSATEVKAMIM